MICIDHGLLNLMLVLSGAGAMAITVLVHLWWTTRNNNGEN